MTQNSCIIVGAGISGLLAATDLQAAGWTVTVLDKGRGVGGRMATRRIDGTSFDHGAQFFTVRNERFQKLVDGWLAAGAAAEWSRGFPNASGEGGNDGHPRYRGSNGMTSIPKHLAQNLDVETSEKVVELQQVDESWRAVCESGLSISAGALAITAPAPQARALAQSGGYELDRDVRGALERIVYDPCLAVMALLSESAGIPAPGGVQIKDEPLDWIGDNRQKGISEQPALTVHGGPNWSREHYEDPEDDVTAKLISLASNQLGTDLSALVRETSLHRWRYSWVTESHPEPYLATPDGPPLVFCGDGFGQPKVEGAALSGLAAADYLLGR
jgi:predicted NAD/FAD-dependent oxidoreductase